ncbi:MAG: CoA pyrophosphatase [Chloroflexota bacterium]
MISTLFSTNDIRDRFDRETAVHELVNPATRCAAVAMIFSDNQGELNLCFGLRATYEGDPWSGDMAFPGGKSEPGDQTFHQVAQRETMEEIGFLLKEAELVGGLDPMTLSNKKRVDLILKPMIYVLNRTPPPFQISSELEKAFWIPVSHLWQTANWKKQHVQWRDQWYPGIQFDDQVIWGLTLRILMDFSQQLGYPLTR